MGTSVITIRVTGNHGCQREVKSGGTTAPVCAACNGDTTNCVDSIARQFVERLSRSNSVEEAYLVHWPNNEQIIDNLKTGKRNGSF